MRKYIKLAISVLTVLVLVAGCSSKKAEEKEIEYNIDPISKETAIKILKNEYGDLIDVDIEDIKQVKDEYVVELTANIKDDAGEEHDHEYDEDGHTDMQDLGTIKINIYTGDIIE